jgi:hypothetical protein
MTAEEMSARVTRLEKALLTMRRTVKIAVLMAILGWIGCVAQWLHFATTVPSRLVVKDSLGDTAVLDANGLWFKGPKDMSVAWFAARPDPVLAMTVDGVSYVRLQVSTFEDRTLGQPQGIVQLNAKDGLPRTLTALPRAQPPQ